MRVSVIPEDQKIIIDGVAANCVFDTDANIHAIQWYNNRGVIEYKIGPAVAFNDANIILPFVDTAQNSLETIPPT